MKKLVLILGIISPALQAMYMDDSNSRIRQRHTNDDHLSVGELQKQICAENKRILEKRQEESAKIQAARSASDKRILLCCALTYAVVITSDVLCPNTSNK